MDIPTSAAKQIADKYDYDQVIIFARKVDRNEHLTTYGKTKQHCKIAGDIGNFLKYKIMRWLKPASGTKGGEGKGEEAVWKIKK